MTAAATAVPESLDRRPMRILIIEDDPAAARLAETVLRAHAHEQIRLVSTAADGIAAAAHADIILLDHQLPDGTGLDILASLRAHPSRPSIIMVTGHGSENLAAQALRLGADDYLIKDGALAALLPEVVERVRRARALQAALYVAERDLMRAERLAAVGELTVTLHHEINNPLMAATAAVDFLMHGAHPLAGPQAEELREVAQALERIRLIVQRVGTLTAVPSRQYVGDTRMLDLSDTRETPAVQRGIAGIWTSEEDVARVSGMLLRRQGWRVERCADVEAVQRVVRTIGVGLLVLQAQDPALGDPFGGFRPAPDRDYRIAVLSDQAAVGDLVRADVRLSLPFDPHQFAAEVQAHLV